MAISFIVQLLFLEPHNVLMVLHNNICASRLFVLSVTTFGKSPLPGSFSNQIPILMGISVQGEKPVLQVEALPIFAIRGKGTQWRRQQKSFGLLYMKTTAKGSVFFACR
jgi:hypothetical protein